ncbi:hypothetical protein MMC07_003884 [Pseudocyphellaria aurata]|nr:hypothetical protein [Pseudocyphellaria aurata]
MRFLVFLMVVAMFAALTASQVFDDVNFNPDDPIDVPKIEGADDDKTVCDNGSDDGRLTRACCLGAPDAPTPDGGFVRVYKCRKYSPEEPDCNAPGVVKYCCVSILVSFAHCLFAHPKELLRPPKFLG